MFRPRAMKLMHFASTSWFMLCIVYILVLALQQAGVKWWIIFSLSGHSALLIFLLVSLYLFAIFRGVDRSQKIEAEHPLTSTDYYMVFYLAAPFLGSLAGTLGMIGENRISHFLLGITLGTLGTTFLVWVIVDPATGLVEMLLLPASRKHRIERIAQVRALRQKRQEEQKRLLDEILAQEERDRRRQRQALQPYAEKLAQLLAKFEIGDKQAEIEAVDIGANAWQMCGLNCMRQLHSMAKELCRNKCQDSTIVDYIPTWWDGIGSWRNPSLG